MLAIKKKWRPKNIENHVQNIVLLRRSKNIVDYVLNNLKNCGVKVLRRQNVEQTKKTAKQTQKETIK